MRTIEAPGVEWKEYDLSQVAPAMGGPVALTFGFADKGQKETIYNITGSASDRVIFGTPKTEAERYFYKARMKVLNQRGTLLAAKIPYTNDSEGIYNVVDYKFTLVTPPTASTSADLTLSEKLYSALAKPSTGIERLITIDNNSSVGRISEDALGMYRIGMIPETDKMSDIITPDTIRIVDISHASLGIDAFGYERLGTFPVVVAAGNVLLNQAILTKDDLSAIAQEETINNGTISFDQVFQPIVAAGYINGISGENYTYNYFGTDKNHQVGSGNVNYNASATLIDFEVETPLASVNNGTSLSLEVMNLFDTINVTETGTIDNENTKYITVAIVEAYKDTLAGNKINFRIKESFTGSPWIGATDPTTGASVYLGDLINGNSNYIEFYTSLDRLGSLTQEPNDIYFTNVNNKIAYETSFTQTMCEKNISEAQIIQSLQTIFNKCSNINAQDIDYVVDAGISNIAQYLAFVKPANYNSEDPFKAKYQPTLQKWKLKSRGDTLSWRSIYSIYNTFCQNTRKDCMFLFDALRPLTLEGSQKIVRATKPSHNFDVDIYPKVNLMAGLNTSYGAGYSIWYYGQDDFTGDYIWLPPSIQAVGVNCFCDINANYWDAPAGLNRGILADALDISYNPGPVQSGMLYKKGWNFMVNWPADGITLEGQKTLQVKPSAFDRINVRKLFLRLERQTYKTCRYFVYEGNTAFTRQRILDAISPMFNDAKVRGGLYDYKIVCDSSNNTPDVIDRNELVIDIALKPTRTAEFILLNFYALRTGASWSEAGM